MKTFLILGGTKGIGLSISKQLANEGHKVFIISRDNYINIEKIPNVKIIKVDLLNLEKQNIDEIFNNHPIFDGICFAQRYRGSYKGKSNKSLEEYKVMVDSIANFIIQFNQHIKKSKNSKNINIDKISRLLIIGSTYSTRIGKDQDWSYHSVKSAQLSLVKYFSLNSGGFFNINMLSPGTVVKENSDSFWSDHPKNKHWIEYTSVGLINSKIVAKEAINIMKNSSIYFTGNNVKIDSGLSNLYHDQLK